MDNLKLKNRKSEKGFTLVELAVVMIIIGVLIGGILKGQEMVTNARLTATAGDMERFGAAYNSFLDQYNSQPGDMNNAAARIADCANYAACVNGNGNGVINSVLGAAVAANEGTYFFGQLLSAGLISGLSGTNNGATAAFGTTNPSAPVGGGFIVGDIRAGGTAAGGFNTASMRARPHIILDGITGATTATSGVITGDEASRIDIRLDDGNPNFGVIVSSTGTGSCTSATTATVVTYDAPNSPCAIAYRL